MGFENGIIGAIQQIKGVLFDVVSDIQNVISSLELSLNDVQNSEDKKNISTLIEQLQSQLSLILTNTTSLTNSILGYKVLLDNTLFTKDSTVEAIENVSPKESSIEGANSVSETAVTKPSVDLPLPDSSKVADNTKDIPEKVEDKPATGLPLPDSSKVANSTKDIPGKVEDKPATGLPLPDSSKVADSTKDIPEKVEDKPATGLPLPDSSKVADSTKDIPGKVEVKPATGLPLPDSSKVANSTEDIPGKVEDKPATGLPLPDSSKVADSTKDSPEKEENKPTTILPLIDSTQNNSETQNVADPIIDPIMVMTPDNNDSVIENKDSSLENNLLISSDNKEVNNISKPAPASQVEDTNSLVPFRIGDESVENNKPAGNTIASLGEDIPSNTLTFLAGVTIPKVIVVTSKQFNKLQASCKTQAAKLDSNGEVTKENLEELMSNLPSLYEINPEEAEKLSEKITAKLQELEGDSKE